MADAQCAPVAAVSMSKRGAQAASKVSELALDTAGHLATLKILTLLDTINKLLGYSVLDYHCVKFHSIGAPFTVACFLLLTNYLV